MGACAEYRSLVKARSGSNEYAYGFQIQLSSVSYAAGIHSCDDGGISLSRFEERRAELLADATNDVSRAIVEALPHMVSHPVPRTPRVLPGDDSPGICAQDIDLGGAIGCTPKEGYILNRAAACARPKHMLEIGSYVGWSSAHLLYGNKLRLTCIDSLREGIGLLLDEPNIDVLLRFHENMRALDMGDRVTLIPEESPGCLKDIAPKHGWQFVFVDGWHFDQQPLHDVQGLLPYMNPSGVIFVHDMGLHDVYEATQYLIEQGWTYYGFLTPNNLAAFWLTEPKWWARFLRSIA